MTARSASILLAIVVWLCFAVQVAGIVWASSRGLELTDESYYLLSAIYPEQVTLYISAQHWILGPLWQLTENLQGFRLTGAAILVGSAAVLALGATRAFTHLTGGHGATPVAIGMTIAASGIGALLYVVTIAPSPSYNLLGSSGAYAGFGFALLSLNRSRWALQVFYAGLGGAALAVCFVCKPSAGLSVGLVTLLVVLALERRPRKWAICAMGVISALGAVMLMVALQPRGASVIESLRGGLDLFRMVQTEPVMDRLIRYCITLMTSFAKSLGAFGLVVLLVILSWRYPRRWLFALTLLVWILNLYANHSFLAGSTALVRMAEAIYILIFVIVALGLRGAAYPKQAKLLLGALLSLPFAATIGTGNALFTQVIVALAPWTVGAALLSFGSSSKLQTIPLQWGATGLLLILLAAQTTTSYLRDPYHLAAPLIAQTETVILAPLGTIKVDPQTDLFLKQIAKAKQTCALVPGGAYFGLFNLPGLALTLGLVPPVTPWVNNSDQAAKVLQHWSPHQYNRIVIALSTEAQATPSLVPAILRPVPNGYLFCGRATVPYESQVIEIWASPK